MIALVLLFTAIFATISTIDDRKQGFLQGVLVAPITRTTVVMAQALGGTHAGAGSGDHLPGSGAAGGYRL